jgi:hypothetical protein
LGHTLHYSSGLSTWEPTNDEHSPSRSRFRARSRCMHAVSGARRTTWMDGPTPTTTTLPAKNESSARASCQCNACMHAQPAGHLTVRRPDQGYQDQDNICLTILDVTAPRFYQILHVIIYSIYTRALQQNIIICSNKSYN